MGKQAGEREVRGVREGGEEGGIAVGHSWGGGKTLLGLKGGERG